MNGGSIQGKAAIVTGESSGIGWACAKLFVYRGGTVALLDTDAANEASRAKELSTSGHYAVFLEADVSSEEQVRGRLSHEWVSFHHPTAGLISGLCALGMGLFSPLLDVRLIVAGQYGIPGRHAFLARICAEVLLLRAGVWLRHHHLIQRWPTAV